MASKDLPKGQMVPKTNTSSSSSVAPRKYGAHSGLKFKFNLDKNSISKLTIDVENRTEERLPPRKLYAQIEPKGTQNLASNAITNSNILERQKKKEKPPLPENEEHPGMKTNLERESKEKSATIQSIIEKEKQPPREDEGHLVLKFKLQRDSIKNSATSKSKIEKEKPLSVKDGHLGLKIKLEKDSKKSIILERKTNKEKPPLPEDGRVGLKTDLEKNAKEKSATKQSKIEKEKPPRKYGAHSGLKFKFNIEKSVIPKTFIIESSTADTKRYADIKKIGTVTMETFESQTHKEHHNPDVEKYASTTKEREKTLRECESFYDVEENVVEENGQDDFEILSKKEFAKFFLKKCSNSVTSYRDLKHQHKSPKITKSHAGDTLNPPELASTASNLSSLNVPQISKGRPTITKEPPIPSYSHAMTDRTITTQTFESEAVKEERHKSGVKKYETSLEEDEKTLDESEFFYDVAVEENMKDDFEILPKKEMAKLRNKSIASTRDLKHQHKNSKITNSLAYDALKPPEIASKASNFSSCNVPQISKGCTSVSTKSKVYETRFSDDPRPCTIAMKVADNQTLKEERHKSGVKKYETNLEEDECEFFYDVVVEENMQDDFEILPKKEMTKLRSKSIASSRDLKHQHKSSKITNSLAYDALKPPEIASKASNFSSCNVPQISKCCTPVSMKSKVYETRFSDDPRPCTIAMKVADNQTLKEQRHKSGVIKYESDLKEEDVQTLPDIDSFYKVIKENVQDYYEVKPLDATSVGAITMEIDDFVPIKKSHKSGKGKHFSTQKDDFKLGGQSGQNSISMKSVQEDTKMSIENESEDLCSRVATSLRVLQPQLRALKISKSQVSDASKSEAIVCKTSTLPMLNIPQKSRGQPTKLEEPMTPASPRKYGFHSGLRFSFKEKKAIPVDINFNRTPSLQKDKCFKNEKRDPAS